MTNVIRIKELCEKYNLTTRTIRFWEEKGLLESAFRTAGKRRNFGADIEKRIEDILHYKNKGISLEKIKDLLGKKKTSTVPKAGKAMRILVDSTSSIDPDMADQNNIDVIPLYIQINNKTYLDGLNIQEEDFYEKIAKFKGENIALKTAPPTVEDFFQQYSKMVQEGAKTIFSIHISSKFSQTVENAQKAAAKFSGITIHVIDSRTSGQALTMLALALKEKLEAGWSDLECVSYLEKLIVRNWLIVTITSVKSLAILGTLNLNVDVAYHSLLEEVLNFRPVLLMEKGEASFKLLARANELEEALELMAVTLKNTPKTSKLKMIGISHSRLDQPAAKLKKILEKQYGVPVLVQKGSVVLCTHLGPTSLGINILFDV